MQLEPANVVDRRCVGRTREKRRETLAAADVASLRVRTELARVHVLDHALAQRGDRLRTHGKLLSGMRLMTPRSSRQDASSAMAISTLAHVARPLPQQAIAQRFSALARLGPAKVSAIRPLRSCRCLRSSWPRTGKC